MKLLATGLFALLTVFPVAAQDTIATDRPDFTESTSTVPHRTVQAEFGFTRASADDLSLTTTGEGLIRYGVQSRFEVRLGLPSHIDVEGLDAGLGDMNLGVKWHMASFGEGGKASLVGTLTLPTGEDDLSAGEVEPTVLAVAGTPLSDRVGLAGQVGVQYFKTEDDWQGSYLATAVLGLSLIENVGAFAELRIDKTKDVDAQLVSHVGLTYLFSPDFQVDIHGGLGLTDTAPDQFFGFGLAIRR